MIRLERPSPPAELDPAQARVQQALTELDRYWRRKATGKSQQRPPSSPSIYGHPSVRAVLVGASNGKCAYCETIYATGLGVEHFRPTMGAIGADGTESRDHYWWLTYEWTNLLPACVECNRTKGSRFPVRGDRATRETSVDDEDKLLLDPFSDEPDADLVFLTDGTVASETERGQVTIDVLGLNRAGLLAARRDTVSEVRAFDLASTKSGAARDKTIADILAPSRPYLALRRQLVATTRKDPTLSTASVAPAARRHTKAVFDASQSAKQSYALDDNLGALPDQDKTNYYGSARWIERVVIRNFKPIKDLHLDLTRSTSTTCPWSALLGDNGSGKSSILQAIALTLVGEPHRSNLGADPSRLVRHGTKRGSVQVWLSGLPDPLVLRFGADGTGIEGPPSPQVLLLGYGSMRLLPRTPTPGASPTHGPPTPGVARVDNLFDPFRPLTDPTDWLLSLDDEMFDDVAVSLKKLLALDATSQLRRDPDRSEVYVHGGRRSRARDTLDELSDGYQSMLVLACDVMKTVLSLWSMPEHAEGIVLIDELGAHLHPRWRMRIVPALREILPRVQFVITTHDPLCLRGLEDGEVIVVHRNERREVVTLTDLPPVKGLRVEQLLTSEHFGLGSTEDPEIDDLFREYYELRGQKRLTAVQRARMGTVEARLGELRQLGATERERMLLAAADRFIAERRESGDAPVTPAPGAAPAPDERRREVEQELAEIWSAKLPAPTAVE
jgi:uncharacterized protein (TIGR02646 family)